MDGDAYGWNHLSVHCGGIHQGSSTDGRTCRNGVAGTCYSYCSNKTWCQLSRTGGIAPAVAGFPFLCSGPQLVYDESRLILVSLWKPERG
jgi:hypothetical protein